MLQTSSVIRCPKCDVELKAVWSDKGVVLDHCEKCKGVWMDGGEIYHFSRDPARIHWALEQGLRKPHDTKHRCPRCKTKLTEGGLLSDTLLVDHCGTCQGIWLDRNELEDLQALDVGGHRPARERKSASDAPSPGADRVVRAMAAAALPNLYLKSAGVLALLYGLLFLVFAVAAEAGAFPLWVAMVITLLIVGIQFAVSPFIMDYMLQWTMSLRWVQKGDLPPHLVAFLEGLAQKHNIPFPRMGIIDDGTPTAFTFGHAPTNARVVVSRGLIDLLEADELESVVGHEMGHALHWDMLVMTVAALVPMILYFVFRTALRMRGRNNPGPAIALVAYLLYLVSQYILLWLSRTREYFADQFGGEATGKPAALASALTKIAYGLAGSQERRKLEEQAAKGNADAEARLKTQDPHRLDAISALGIFDAASARALVATSVGGMAIEPGKSAAVDPERLKDAMQWDLWNPWAGWHELHSTHPLPAKRIQALSDQAEAVGQKAYIHFDRQQPESYWDDFLLDLSVLAAPWALTIGGLVVGLARGSAGATFGLAAAGLGAGGLLCTLYRYRGNLFPKSSVAGLLKNVKVSDVTPVPAQIRGKIIGKGIPGLIWSEDFVMQDGTGYIFLDYRQPLGIFEFLFGLFRTPGIIGREVVATGWYRRSPIPYFELQSLVVQDGAQSREHRCYVYTTKLVFEALLLAGGLLLALLAR